MIGCLKALTMATLLLTRRRFLWPATALIVASILGCRRTRARTVHKEITYANTRDGVFYYGRISDLDGSISSSWSVRKDGQETVVNQLMEEETFQFLCKGTKDY